MILYHGSNGVVSKLKLFQRNRFFRRLNQQFGDF